MSIIHFDAMPATAADNTIVTITPSTASDQTGFLTATAGFEWRSDGTLFKRSGLSWFQVGTLTDWIIPRTEASSLYQLRVQNGPNWKAGTPPRDTWINMGITNSFIADCSRFCVQSDIFVCDIRFDGGTDTNINSVSSLHDGSNCMASSWMVITLEAT